MQREIQGPVHTYPDIFENASFFIRTKIYAFTQGAFSTMSPFTQKHYDIRNPKTDKPNCSRVIPKDPSAFYNACQKSLEHLGHFFIIRISNHSHQVQIPLSPETMLISKVIVPAFQQSRGSSCHPNFLTTKQHCFKGWEGEIAKQGKISRGVPRLLASIVDAF